MKQTLTVHTLLCGVERRVVFVHKDAERPILQAHYQQYSLHLERRMREACDSLPLLWGAPALVPRNAFAQTEIPWVRQAKGKEEKRFIWCSG